MFDCVLLVEKTNHVLTKLNLATDSIAAKRDPFNIKQFLCTRHYSPLSLSSFSGSIGSIHDIMFSKVTPLPIFSSYEAKPARAKIS